MASIFLQPGILFRSCPECKILSIWTTSHNGESINSASFIPRMCFSYLRSIPMSCSWSHFLLLLGDFCSTNYSTYLCLLSFLDSLTSVCQPQNMLNLAHHKIITKIRSFPLDSYILVIAILVNVDCYNKIPQTRWLKRNFFLLMKIFIKYLLKIKIHQNVYVSMLC